MLSQQPGQNEQPNSNQNEIPQEGSYKDNIQNYELNIPQQNQIIDNLSIEEILQKIDIYLQEKNLSELTKILKLSHNKIPKNKLSSYISDNLGNIDIIKIFLDSGADINSYIHCANYKIDESDKTNLLMFSIFTGNMALFNLVLKYHPDVLQEDKHKKNSIFYYISFKDEPNMLHELLKLNPNAINSTFYDPENNITHNLLTFAVFKNKKDLCSVLIKDNCNLNYQIPETGDTFVHLMVKTDNCDLAKLFYNLPNIDKSLKNKDGKTARELGEEKKGNIFFQIICTENNINNKLNTNTNKQINNEIFNKISSKLNKTNIYDYNNDNNYYYENIPQDRYIVPIEFKNIDYPTYLSMEEEMKLCLNLYKGDDFLIKEKERLTKRKVELELQLNEIKKDNEAKCNILSNLENQMFDIDKDIKEKTEEIKKTKNEIINQENKNILYQKYLTKLTEDISLHHDLDNEYSENINTDANIINIINEDQNSGNIINEPHKEENKPLSEEQFQFLKEKFESKMVPDDYIIRSLQKDLEDYQIYIEDIISKKTEKIKDILNQLQSVVDEVNPDYKVNLYGSYSTGLCLPWSDIDTVITYKEGSYSDLFLSDLNNKLAKKPWVKEQKFLDHATVPIIKITTDEKIDFHIDISLYNEKHFGLKAVELIKKYLNKYKVLKPIILALKTLLKNGSLNDTYKGGLSSYGLTLMIVSFLQSQIDNKQYNEESPILLGEMFINVLQHYGIFFDYSNYVILTYPLDYNPENNERDGSFLFHSNPHELIIVDPLNNQNNVAKSTYQFMNIKMGFLIAYMASKEDCECGCHYEILRNKRFSEHGHCILNRILNCIKRFKDANKSNE